MIRKIVSLALALTMSASLFAGCGSKATTSATDTSIAASTSSTEVTATPSPEPEKFTIKVSGWFLDDVKDVGTKDFKLNVENDYKTKYPGATIEWNNFNGEQYFNVLKAKLASNSGDDVFFHQSILPFAEAGYMTDLSDQPWVSDLLDNAKAQVTVKGKVVAAPLDYGGWGTFYSKKIYTDLGLSVPKNTKELLDNCEKIKTSNIIPFTGGFKDGWPATGTYDAFAPTFLYANNPNFAYDLFDGKAKVNGPEFISFLTSLQTMVEKGYFSKNALSTTFDQAAQELGTGKAAMMFMVPGIVGVETDKYKTELGFFVMPDENGNTVLTGGVNRVVSINSQYKDTKKGTDLINSFITKPALDALLTNSAFSAYKSITITQTASGNLEFGQILAQSKTNIQPDGMIPPSCVTLMTQLVTKIIAGKKFVNEDLDNIDKAYSKDKALVLLPK